jgi:phosphoribosylformylglycinamidine synthase
VRVGKLIEIELSGSNKTQAKKDLERMCHKLLANPVIEAYRIELEG